MENSTITAAQQFDEKRFTKIDIVKTRRSVAFMLNFLPDQEMRPHNHPNRELYLLVMEGSGTFNIDGEKFEAKQGDVLLCNEDEQIGFVNTGGKNVSIYVTMTKLSLI